MKIKFVHEDGRIYLEVYQQIWSDGEDDSVIVLREDVTDRVMPVVDDYLDEQLGLNDYKRVNGVITYVGKDKDRYQK